MQFVSGSKGWVAGWDQILGTGDGGRHWVTKYRTTAAAALATVDFADGTHGWVVGASTILVTVDGGGHWRALPEPCPVIRTVHFISPAVGFAVAGGSLPWLGVPPVGGVLLRTTDGGRHWQRLAAPANAQTVCFADPSAAGSARTDESTARWTAARAGHSPSGVPMARRTRRRWLRWNARDLPQPGRRSSAPVP